MKMGDDSVEQVEVIPTGSIALNVALGVGGCLLYTSMERRASKSIYNRMISLKFLLGVSIYDRQGMSVSTYKELSLIHI